MATREQTYLPPGSDEQALTRVLTRAYALNWEVVAYAVILVVALVTRFADLGTRVMSHDESLHTYYSWRLYEFGEFQHTPLMHGPLLFHMTALSYFLFGDNDFTARIYPAALGVLIVMFPLLFRRWLGRVGAVAASVMLLISPQLLYYSRYIRHDIPTIFFALLLLYAALQYVDGVRPRRPVWLWVLAATLLGMLASKEVAFIYIAIFGSFLTLFWLMRMAQDIGIRRRPADATGWHPPAVQLAIGHGLLLVFAGLAAWGLGALLRYLFLPVMWIPSDLWFQAPLFLVIYLPLALSGVVRNMLARDGVTRRGAAAALMRGLSNGRSALQIIMAGVMLGAIMALVVIVVADVIKPDTVWQSRAVMSEYDQLYGANATKEFATSIEFNASMFVRLLTWIGLPALVLLMVLILSAVFNFPSRLPLPRREIVLIILLALLVTVVLVKFERRSFVEEATAQPFAADPTAASTFEADQYDNTPIWVAWGIGIVVVIGVLATRFLTHWWDFINRQPIFDILIVIGTLILPWLAAFPLYWAGYNLEEYNPNSADGRDTLNAAVAAFIPFLAVSVSVGLAWNWKRWLPAGAIFIGLFAFFFTTVFSNQYGLATGMIGSLGYWLEQQGVRRGSQPQYYYILTQLPVYEFLPLIGAMLAGVTGLSGLWRWRRQQVEADRHAAEAAAPVVVEHNPAPASDTLIAEGRQTQALLPPEPDEAALEVEIEEDDPAEEPVPGGSIGGEPVSVVRYAGVPSRLFRPYSLEEELSHRAENREWLGAIPLLALVGYWAIMILLGLTMAGEKMPWLTTHLTVPLILAAGWWVGHLVGGIRWPLLRDGGWLLLLVAMPLAFVALAQVLLPVWGQGGPFQGRTAEDLATTGTWLAALLILFGALYLIGRIGQRLGLAQLGRMALLTFAMILAILTARAAVLASYINYDYATEYLVYAHAGPAIKTVLNEVDRIAEITNEGSNMRIVYDDESSWPYTWYFRDYPNYGFLRGESGSVDAATLDGAKIVVVGNKKVSDVRRILGDQYYEFGYIRLWWPMQEYFNLSFGRVANLFSTDPFNLAAEYYRQGLFDIWLRRDYSTYGQAICIEDRQSRCESEAEVGETAEERDRLRAICQSAVAAECKDDDRFDVTNWPVSDRMFFFVDKQIAAQVWDAGVGSTSVDIREPEYPEDTVFAEVPAEAVIARAVGMLGPRDIAIDAEGLLYVTDTDRNRIVVLNPQGEEVRTIGGDAPNGGSEPGQLRQPWGVAIGPDGNLYVADTWNHRVQVFNPEGEWLRGWGHEGLPAQDPSPDAFWGPRDIAVGADGTVYVADTGNKRVRVYTSEGEWLRDIGTPGAALGQVDEPSGLAINPVSGHLYVAEAWNQRIQTFDQEGFPINAWDVNMWFRNRQSFNRPYVAVSPDGTLVYVTDMDDRHRVVAYNLSGEPVLSFNHPDNLESGQLGLRSPAGMAFDAQGRLYVVDAELAQIYVFPPAEVSGSIPPGAPLDEGAEMTGGDTDMTEIGVEVEIIPPPGTDESTDLTGVMDATAEATEEAAEAITAPATEEAPAG